MQDRNQDPDLHIHNRLQVTIYTAKLTMSLCDLVHHGGLLHRSGKARRQSQAPQQRAESNKSQRV